MHSNTASGGGRELSIFTAMSARRMPQLIQRVNEEDPGVEETEIHRKLCEWIEAGVLIKIDDAYLSLALMS